MITINKAEYELLINKWAEKLYCLREDAICNGFKNGGGISWEGCYGEGHDG